MSTVLTGALGIIRVNGTAIGRVRGIRVNENLTRGDVRGVGTLLTSEAPVLQWAGSITVDFYEVDFRRTGIENAIRRDVQTNQEFEDNLLLDCDGVQIDVFKKVEDFIDPNTGLRRPRAIPHAIVRRCLIEADGFDLTEAAISGHNQSFRFLDPIIYPQ